MVLPSLDTLSTELLLKIFKYLDICDLCKLKQTCKRFNEIIEVWANSLIKNLKPLVTNQVSPLIVNRSARLLSPFERLRVSRNWKLGVYREQSLLYKRVKYIPWLQLEKKLLWVSREGSISAYKRTSKGIDTRQVVYSLKGRTKAEVWHFVKKDDYILSGQTDGSLWLWSVNDQKFVFELENCHDFDIHAVDMSEEILVSGSKDNYVKIWQRPAHDIANIELCKIDLNDRVWAVALSDDDKSLLAIGTSGLSCMPMLTVYDIFKQKDISKFQNGRRGSGVLDIKWDTPFTIWSCGYDAQLKRWDLRTGNCEQVLEDPCESVIYCFEYDHLNTIIGGTQNNGRAVLWDTRQKNYVQMYFMESCRRGGKSSPVYSLSYDADFLFSATDQHVNILDFSILKGNFRDYSNFITNQNV